MNHADPGCKQSETQLLVISRKSLRQAVCVLFSLMRVREILARSEASAEPTPQEHAHVVSALRQHHVEAAGDLFRLVGGT